MEVDTTRLNSLVKMVSEIVSEYDDICYYCPLRGTEIKCSYNGGYLNTQWSCNTALLRWLKGAQN